MNPSVYCDSIPPVLVFRLHTLDQYSTFFGDGAVEYLIYADGACLETDTACPYNVVFRM